MGLGLVFSWPGWAILFAVTAFVIGSGSAVSTPASSDLLGRYCPPRHAPLIFSIKQTGVPVGGILAGALVPAFTIALGWQGAFVACGAMCLVLAFALQPLRAEFDQYRVRSHRISMQAVLHTVRAVLVHRRLRELALCSVSWVGLQASTARSSLRSSRTGSGTRRRRRGGCSRPETRPPSGRGFSGGGSRAGSSTRAPCSEGLRW